MEERFGIGQKQGRLQKKVFRKHLIGVRHMNPSFSWDHIRQYIEDTLFRSDDMLEKNFNS